MHKIKIYKDKITNTDWDQKTNTWIEATIPDSVSILRYLNQLVEIDEDVTVEDFMLHLEKYQKEIDLCFCSYSNNLPLDLYLQEMRLPVDRETNVEHIEMFWAGEVLEEELAIVGSLRGWVSDETAKAKGIDPNTNYGMEYTPINIWKHCKFSLHELLVINNVNPETLFEDEAIFDGFFRWTLFDLISNFLCDLTEGGSPEEREKQIAELEQEVQQVIENPKTAEQALFWIEFLEADLSDAKSDLEKALDVENYEEAARLKSKIDVLKAEIDELNKNLDNIEENE